MSTLGLTVLAAPATGAQSRMVWTAAALAWVLAVPLFYVSKFASVVAHEGGHALATKLLLGKVYGVSFDRGGGGATDADIAWPLKILVLLAGYWGPSGFGLLAAWLLTRGDVHLVLWASLAFLVVMLLVVRGWLGWLLVPVLVVVIALVLAKTGPPLQTLYTYVWVWFLLISAVQDMLLFVWQKAYRRKDSDAGRLGQSALLPAELWALIFLVGAVAALVYGGTLLLRPAS